MNTRRLVFWIAVMFLVIGAGLVVLGFWSVVNHLSDEKAHPSILLWPIPAGFVAAILAALIIQNGDIKDALETVTSRIPLANFFAGAFSFGGRRAGDPPASPSVAAAVASLPMQLVGKTGDMVVLHAETTEPHVQDDGRDV